MICVHLSTAIDVMAACCHSRSFGGAAVAEHRDTARGRAKSPAGRAIARYVTPLRAA